MTKHHLSLVIALVVGVAVLAGGWFLGVQPQLAGAASNRVQQATIDATNDKNRAELTRLAAAFSGLDATRAELERLRASVPSTVDSESFVREIDADAAAAGVQVTNVTIGDATPYAPASAESASAEPASAVTATPGATADGAEETPSAQAATDPSITDANFSLVPVTVAVQGSYDQALAFTKAMQSGSRLFLVSGIAAASEEEGDSPPMQSQSWSLSGSVYVFTGTSSSASTNG
ncbi:MULTISPECIES: hypothetical protein [Curtobacterium]|uniref:hypothetical protein n=1 Tax=Curtobacterium TaxID=2034 RepID=UPI000F89C8BA|nr:hypothetical protein [Curtobacterium sp. HSID17257]RUQ07916.1 hypothetical protein D8M35_05505 [Curtobacterium sp. HSID17257]